MSAYEIGWWRGAAVTRKVKSTKLLHGGSD